MPETRSAAGAEESYLSRIVDQVKSIFRRPAPAAKMAPSPSVVLGRAGEPLRALAFAGGGFDTAIQLGVAHALLVADAHPPDVVVGISAGATNAVALAEILRAGNGAAPEQQSAARVAKFRQMLEAWREVPGELLGDLLPDPYEVTARAPLKPQELPIHFVAERAERSRAVNARFGIIRLLNDLLAVRIQLRTATQILRLCLELRRLGECQKPLKRIGLKVYEFLKLWLLLGTKLFILATPVSNFLFAIIWAGPYQRLLRRLERTMQVRHESPVRQFIERFKTGLLKFVLRVAGYYTDKTAKQIILQSVAWRAVVGALRWVEGFACALAIWLLFGPCYGLYRLMASETARGTPTRPKESGPSYTTRLWNRFLASFDLHKDIATPFLVKPHFVSVFDPSYYGRVNLNDVVDQALQEQGQGIISPSSGDRPTKKPLSAYQRGKYPIYVAPVAADVSRGSLDALPPDTGVVDALLAASAVVPLFRAQQLNEKYYIDGVNVGNEPTYALLDLLLALHRQQITGTRVHDKISNVEIYPVSPFCLADEKLQGNGSVADSTSAKPFELVGTALRALQLKRFQDANLERKMVGLYRRALPEGTGFVDMDGHSFVRGLLRPIETDRLLNLNERVATARDRQARRRLIDEAVAEGCRATLQVILARTLQTVATEGTPQPAEARKIIPCRTAILMRLGNASLPGSNRAGGPGIEEICRECAIHKGLSKVADEALLVTSVKEQAQDWPVRDKQTVAPAAPLPGSATPASQTLVEANPEWPQKRNDLSGQERPTITLLFSGGVFRGVFQVGVVNALNEARVRPDLVAGSSVGSITAALIAQIFHTPELKRPDKIRELASVFLSIDRLVLTDRLSDFVRRITLRASEARFSLRDADQFFRRYDLGGTEHFSRRSRRVIAGLERLVYLNPFGLKELTKALRNRDSIEVNRLLRLYLQNFLDRSGVGQELLGAEPLLLLIQEFILSEHPGVAPDSAEFDLFKGSGIHMLATATNITRGELKILSSVPRDPRLERAVLKEGLLASSAFPAIFRPRWAWEVFSEAPAEQFIDGGVMDNLPLDAVVTFLDRSARKTWIKRQPTVGGQPVPHLLFTASLEVCRRELTDKHLRQITGSWPALANRARRLSYNQKIDKFAKAQEHFRLIYKWRCQHDRSFNPRRWPLLDVETVVVKPEWLPGTFAFNSMLGFRRVNQAASIAHGCASTLVELHRRATQHPDWTSAWGIKDDVDPECVQADRQAPRDHGAGRCWFRNNSSCPFSPSNLQGLGLSALQALAEIYRQCGKRITHSPAQ